MICRYLIIFIFLMCSLFSIENKNEEEPWVVCIKKCGNEKIMIRFPEDPEMKFFKDLPSHHFSSSDEEIHYSLTTLIENEKPSKDVFEEVLKEIQTSKEKKLLEQQEKKIPWGKRLDLKYLISDGQASTVVKTSTIVTKNNIYTLKTSFPQNLEGDQHHIFTKSFSLVKS